MIDTKDIVWLAGLIEGEGCFQSSRTGNHATSRTPTIDIQMTDKDVIEHAASILGANPRKPYRHKQGNHKLVYSVVVCGTRAISWMMTLYTLMGERRQAKIKEIIEAWKKSPNTPRAPRGQRFMATCHPGQPRKGRGLCGTCYMREWRKRTGRDGAYYRRLAAQEG